MYVPEYFRESDLESIEWFLHDVALAELVSWNGTDIEASTVPLIFERVGSESARLVGHLARANPQWKSLGGDTEVLVIFRGPDDYISPASYPTKKENGRVVPTWNYAAVHLHGTATVHDDDDWKFSLVSRLTDLHESARTLPWAVTDAPSDYVANQLRAIVGIEIVITSLDAKWKLSQNQPEKNRIGVIEELEHKGTARSLGLARFMQSSS